MKKLALFTFLGFSVFSFAQIGIGTGIGSDQSRWTIGGGANVGFSGGTYGSGFSLGITPRVGYMVTDNFEAGVAAGINWANNDYFRTTMIGVGPFANYYVSQNLFLNAMYQHYFFNQKDKYYGYQYAADEPALYLGGGYLQRAGGSTFIQIGAMYNVLYKRDSSVFGGGFIPNIGIVTRL